MARPSEYDPAYCDKATDFLKDGYSIAALAGELGCARSTVYKWIDEHEEFSDAVKIGQAAGVLAWEQRLRSLSITGEGNATAIIFGLKNRVPDEWRDMKQTELTGKDGGPIATKDMTRYSDDELHRIASEG